MPLTEHQAELARLLSQNRTFDSYLAGGGAILIDPETTRFSRDLDYFHDSETRVAEAFAADREMLEANGYSLDVDLNRPGYIRAIVRASLCPLLPGSSARRHCSLLTISAFTFDGLLYALACKESGSGGSMPSGSCC